MLNPEVHVTRISHRGYDSGIRQVLGIIESYLTNFGREKRKIAFEDRAMDYHFLIKTTIR